MIVPHLETCVSVILGKNPVPENMYCAAGRVAQTGGGGGEFCFHRHSTGKGFVSSLPVCLHFYILDAFLFIKERVGGSGLYKGILRGLCFTRYLWCVDAELCGGLYSTVSETCGPQQWHWSLTFFNVFFLCFPSKKRISIFRFLIIKFLFFIQTFVCCRIAG